MLAGSSRVLARRAAALSPRLRMDAQRVPGGKRVTFRANGQALVPVDDHDAPADRPLDAYMALPPEEWIEIDPRCIQRLKATTPGEQRYQLTVPIQLGANATVSASCAVRVRVDSSQRTLRIEGRKATLSVQNDDDLSALADATADAAAPAVEAAPPGIAFAASKVAANTSRLAESISRAAMEVDFEAVARWTPGSDGEQPSRGAASGLRRAAGPRAASNGTLDLSTRTSVALNLPPPLSRMPRLVLGSAGNLVLRVLTKSLLPEFGKLIAADYRAWSRGLERTGGDVLSSLGGRGAPTALQADAQASSSPTSQSPSQST